MEMKIKPEDMIDELGIEGLCQSADNYFKSIIDTKDLMAKPFHSVMEGPYLLCKLGLLISGLRLGKSMKVLDFGAGSGWLSRYLNQLGCCTVLLDPSPTALNIAKDLFEKYPIVGDPIEVPLFKTFAGRHIELEDQSVDRIVCFEAFHHVPNPEEILKEFYRILKPGGIAGFGEVGPEHSQSSQSQQEMKAYQVLENDINMEHIKKVSLSLGFSEIYTKLFSHPDKDLSYQDYQKIIRKRKIPKGVAQQVAQDCYDYPIFFLIKGKYYPDSRNHLGLAHRMTVDSRSFQVQPGKLFSLNVEIENTGTAQWLSENIKDIGVVKVGAHLYSEDGSLLEYDYFRLPLNQDVYPGGKLKRQLSLKIEEKGSYIIAFDLVAEHVCWFESQDSKPVSIEVTVK
jgi:ubiquinone/menaquinone biosynthesis C-methylase UbiE